MNRYVVEALDTPVLVDHVAKRFGEVVALDDVSFGVSRGETFGLIGPNGSGKTTLIRLLLGLGRPSSGIVRVLGLAMPDHRVAEHIGYMTQASALYSDLSVVQNLSFFGRLYGLQGDLLRKRIDETLALVELADRGKAIVATLTASRSRWEAWSPA